VLAVAHCGLGAAMAVAAAA